MPARSARARFAVLTALALVVVTGLTAQPAPALEDLRQGADKVRASVTTNVNLITDQVSCALAIVAPYATNNPRALMASADVECSVVVPRIGLEVELWRRDTVMPGSPSAQPVLVGEAPWSEYGNERAVLVRTPDLPCVPGDYQATASGWVDPPRGYEASIAVWQRSRPWLTVTCV